MCVYTEQRAIARRNYLCEEATGCVDAGRLVRWDSGRWAVASCCVACCVEWPCRVPGIMKGTPFGLAAMGQVRQHEAGAWGCADSAGYG